MASDPTHYLNKASFLEQDLYDALRWMVVGAVTWTAPDCRAHPHLKVLSMNTVFVQARALYDFYFGKGIRVDDARASHFVASWADSPSAELSDFLGTGRPANKRVFHLVYDRQAHSGGSSNDESDHLKNQVLNLATRLLDTTCDFVARLDDGLRPSGQLAVRQALRDARACARVYSILDPFARFPDLGRDG